jgi:putative heme-binding domain-containing protein
MQLVEAFPQHQSFGLPLAMLVAPGHPDRSVLYHRIARRGPGQMPPRGTHVVDQAAVQLVRDWITQLPPQRPFVKDWTIDDLAPDVEHLSGGRRYETGARLFKELGCLQCHRYADAGGGAGPDLSGIAKKRSPRELLESILEPSKQIAPEFAAMILVTTEGRTLEGRISEEDQHKLVLHTADALAEPLVLSKHEIEDRHLSTTSTMPDGLLDRLQKTEILDLLAYLIADADPKHSIYTE